MWVEISMKLGLALLSGIVLGLNRWIHHKSAGVRTHSLVALVFTRWAPERTA